MCIEDTLRRGLSLSIRREFIKRIAMVLPFDVLQLKVCGGVFCWCEFPFD